MHRNRHSLKAKLKFSQRLKSAHVVQLRARQQQQADVQSEAGARIPPPSKQLGLNPLIEWRLLSAGVTVAPFAVCMWSFGLFFRIKCDLEQRL